MKLSYLMPLIMMLLLIACKKDKENADAINTTQTDDYTICADDSWVGANEFVGHIPSFIFVYNNKAYVPRDHGMGLPGDRRVYIFDGTTWTDIATNNPVASDRYDAAFTVGSKGYVIFGIGGQHQKQFYEYNLITNVWTRKADYPGEASSNAVTFTIGSKGYVVGGDYFGAYSNETWEYSPATNTWRERKSLFLKTSYASGFSIGSKGYLVHGKTSPVLSDYNPLLEYDPVSNTWVSKASFPGFTRVNGQAFVIGSSAYAGGGTNGPDQLHDFYKYTPSTNSWVRVDDIQSANSLFNSFALNDKGYVVHHPGVNGKSLVRYNPKYCTTIQTGNVVNTGN